MNTPATPTTFLADMIQAYKNRPPMTPWTAQEAATLQAIPDLDDRDSAQEAMQRQKQRNAASKQSDVVEPPLRAKAVP